MPHEEFAFFAVQVKLRTQIATEQERLLGDKDKELESLRQDLATTKDTLKQKLDEVRFHLNDQWVTQSAFSLLIYMWYL